MNDGRIVSPANAFALLLRARRVADHPPVVNAPLISPRAAWRDCAVVGLGGLFYGVTGPLLSTFLPILVQRTLGDWPAAIGAVMAIDNVLLLLLVPLAGAWSDRSVARGRGRLPLVLCGLVLAAVGMAGFPAAAATGFLGLLAAMVLLYSGINVVRSPFHALIADVLPPRLRSLGNGSATFQMCIGAIAFLMLGRIFGMQPAFIAAGATILAIAGLFAATLHEPPHSTSTAVEASYRSLFGAVMAAVRGTIPGLRAMFIAALLLQLTFQTFTTWFSLYGTERFGITAEDVAIGMIAWAVGGAVGALPAGWLGMRFGRRRTMLVGFALLAASVLAVQLTDTIGRTAPLLMLASACWTLPMVNAYPLFVEPIPPEHRGVLASLFLLSMALGGAIGDPLNGTAFWFLGGYRALFLMMAAYASLAFCAVLAVPGGADD